MHHLYPLAKGDPLCPLGFHPQVRWPARCKRCFRDYKEHGDKRRDEQSLKKSDTTSSSPSLSTWGNGSENTRSWASSTNLASGKEGNNGSIKSSKDDDFGNPSSWESTPDLSNLNDNAQANIPTVNLTLPKRKQKPIEAGHRTVSDSVSFRTEKDLVFNKTDSLATRAKKLQAMKEEKSKRIHIKEIKTISEETSSNATNHDVKKAPAKQDSRESDVDDNISLAGTETTDTTLVDINESDLRDQIDSLKNDLDTTKAKCERLEKEKSNILLRRLTAMESSSSKNSTEVLKLQQRCNELQSQLDDYKDEKKILGLRVKELEEDLELRPTAQQAQKIADELRSKLLAAETLCEELMDENEDMKKALRDMEDEMEEMQDNFREDQADEYTSLKKELEQTTKNCRILSFKLRKTERKVEQLENEKSELDKKIQEVSGGSISTYLEKIKTLEKELSAANEKMLSLQKDLEESKSKAETPRKKAPMLGSTKFADGKASRESLTRGASQEDPAQLLRDLQDSMEREADLREQLKFAEEEAQNLRKKASRIEDDNESLVLQLKKMATRARSRKLSPTNIRLSTELSTEKDEGISDDEDIGELKLQLELSEQEASVLRKKVEELEAENDRVKKKTKELQDKLTSKPRRGLFGSDKSDEKAKALEEQLNTFKSKLETKENECEKLTTELRLNKKRTTEKLTTKLADLDQHTVDMKTQLQAVEQEASLLRTRIQNLENENEKLTAENKRFQLSRNSKGLKADKNLNMYIDQIATLEVDLNEAQDKIKDLTDKLNTTTKGTVDNSKLKLIENERDNLANTLTKLKQDSAKAFKDRTPKKPSELTTKSQLKTWVADLENEIGEILVVLKNSESTKSKLEQEIQALKSTSANKSESDIKSKIITLEKELIKEKELSSKEKAKYEDLNKKLQKSKDAIKSLTEERDTFKSNSDAHKNQNTKLQEENSSLTSELNNLKNELGSKTAKNDDTKLLKSELDSKSKELTRVKSELDVTIKKISKLEKDHKDSNDKYSKLEKSKAQLESKMEEEKNKSKSLNSQVDDLNNNILCLESTIKSKNMLIKKLEETLEKEKMESTSKTKTETKQLSDLREELSKAKANLSEVEKKLTTAETAKKTAETKLKRNDEDFRTEKLKLEKNCGDLEVDLQNEKKKLEILKSNYEKEHKNKELELGILRNKIKALEMNSGFGSKKINEVKQEYQSKIEKLEASMAKEKKEYDDLTSRYEILEEEHVVTKAKLITEIGTLNSQLSSTKKELQTLQGELSTLKDSSKKEKLQFQEKLKDYEKSSKNGNDLEKVRLKSVLEETKYELEQLKKENDVVQDQMEYMRRENDELKKKLDDFDKVNKIQRNISADSTAMDKEIRELKIKLQNTEKSKKSDLAEFKLRYESQIKIINEELRSLQTQVSRFKRERDTYKHMLEGAQKTIGELKNNPTSASEHRKSITSFDEMDDFKNKVATLEQQISCMEDELSEARLEGSKLKTELISERSTYEVKLSELYSRVNELEEEKILSSGRTKIAGLRTKMELSWQKEREEQQRLLQETATLARDLRQTLYEVERERDKEKLEGKRKLDQLKKSTEEEQEETKRKLTELQCDLLELRDAHAKLRTTNEKLRREKERQEREREEMKGIIQGRRKTDFSDDRRLSALLDQIEALIQLAPDLVGATSPYTPTPPRRTRNSKSRETSPAIETRNSRESSMIRDDQQSQFKFAMQRLMETTEELRRSQKLSEEDRERDRIKRAMGMRRATSTEHDNGDVVRKTRQYARNGNTTSNLHRKSLSLEHTSLMQEQNIWKGDTDSVSSMQSLEYGSDVGEGRSGNRDVSLDSRLSGGSTQSDAVEKKKKKGIMGKLKKFTKSRSIDDQDFSSTEGLSSKPNSSSDINEDQKGSKRDLKDRLTGIFKRGGSSSRSNSLERQNKAKDNSSSTQRPLMRNENNR